MGMIGLQQISGLFQRRAPSSKDMSNNCPPASSVLKLSQFQDCWKGNRQHNIHSTTQKLKEKQLSLEPEMFTSRDMA